MTIPNRTVSIKSVFASTANTTIPTPPATGVSYRNTGTTAAEIGEGWPYKEIVDSAKFNQAMYEYTTICQQLEKYGFLPWSPNTDYLAGGCALGSDGNVYQAKVNTGPGSTALDPVSDTNHNIWDLFYYSTFPASKALVSNADGKVAASSVTSTELSYLSGVTSGLQTQINNKAANNAVMHLTGNETISGVKTFSSSPIIPTATTGDSSTKAASTAFVTGAINTINNAVVHLAGAETITGEKTFTANQYIKQSVSSITPSEDSEKFLNFVDSNNILIGAIQSKIHSDLTIEAVLFASSMATGTRRDSAVRCVVPASGGGYVVAPASDVNNSILTTVAKSKGNNGYFKLGNGMIVQYGRSSTRTITYPIPFSSDTSFSIVVNNQAGTDGYGRPDSVSNLTRTSCMVGDLSGYPVRWLAIGY